MVKRKEKTKSFTIVEVLIFITLISLIYIVLLRTLTSVIKLNINAENKLIASFLGDELKEWLSGEKEVSWNFLFDKSNKNYCFNNEVINWPNSGLCLENNFSLKKRFKRELHLISKDDRIDYIITVYWREQNQPNFIQIKGLFAKWQN